MQKNQKMFLAEINQRGEMMNGTLYAVLILLLIVGASFLMVGAKLPSTKPETGTGPQVIVDTPVPPAPKSNLQLYTFSGVTVTPTIASNITPTPTPLPNSSDLCKGNPSNTEPSILVGSDPTPGGVIGSGGQIRVWVADELAPFVAPDETVDPVSGIIINPNNPSRTTAKDSNTDGKGQYLWEPTIYLSTSNGPFNCSALSSNCVPHFPKIIKGSYNTANQAKGNGFQSAPVDQDYQNFENGPQYAGNTPVTLPDASAKERKFLGEYIWDVNSLGLQPGVYGAQFVIHDGDINLGIACVVIRII